MKIKLILLILATLLAGCLQNSPTQTGTELSVSGTVGIETQGIQTDTPLIATTHPVESLTQTVWISTPVPTTQPDEAYAGLGWELVYALNASGESGIYIYSPDSEKSRNITQVVSTSGLFLDSTWSPDANWIAYSLSGSGSETYIHIIHPDGTGDRVIANGNEPGWSPDGMRIVYSNVEGDLLISDITTQISSSLLRTEETLEGMPVWSPDGEWIAYLQSRADPDNSANLKIIKPDGSDLHTIDLDNIPGWSKLSWSTDSQHIFYRTFEGCGDIAIVDIMDDTVQILTHTESGEKGPALSPDGQWITYLATEEKIFCIQAGGEPLALGWMIMAMDRNGNAPRLLVSNETDGWLDSPDWNPVTPVEIDTNYSVTVLGEELRLRSSPSTTGEEIIKLEYGEEIHVDDGPVEKDGYTWWQVTVQESGEQGWIVEQPGWLRLSVSDD